MTLIASARLAMHLAAAAAAVALDYLFSSSHGSSFCDGDCEEGAVFWGRPLRHHIVCRLQERDHSYRPESGQHCFFSQRIGRVGQPDRPLRPASMHLLTGTKFPFHKHLANEWSTICPFPESYAWSSLRIVGSQADLTPVRILLPSRWGCGCREDISKELPSLVLPFIAETTVSCAGWRRPLHSMHTHAVAIRRAHRTCL